MRSLDFGLPLRARRLFLVRRAVSRFSTTGSTLAGALQTLDGPFSAVPTPIAVPTAHLKALV